ncbi:MAG: hypothetical protein C4520_07695 [Candidatus Abyssobacteria bacterium SURF_5]|uniref:Uncharacterized protein n=1 Tax=Abyssobacteria bacterium (strain SURF_5) TaxID=2093360 RepID=A0A3A4NR18_ABYX5|nr:MAG: hypothetical protein C4520_07695 [Candidatus Abyssubacteria bacterium SURF_5]
MENEFKVQSSRFKVEEKRDPSTLLRMTNGELIGVHLRSLHFRFSIADFRFWKESVRISRSRIESGTASADKKIPFSNSPNS